MTRPSRRQLFTALGAGIAGLGLGAAAGTGTIRSAPRRAYHAVVSRFIDEGRYFDLSPRRATSDPDPEPLGLFGFTAPPLETVRTGIIGVGRRGTVLARLLANTPGCELVAACDLRASQLDALDAALEEDGNPASFARFSDGPEAYRRLLDLTLDLVVVATPWEDHVPMAVAAMEHEKHVAVEVPICITVEGAWELLETMRKTRRHCMMLENANYGEAEHAVLNMCRHGVFGDIVHGQAAYNHDLLDILPKEDRFHPPFWRLDHHTRRNGNLYPTHGIGPVSKYLGILAGDTMESLVSVSSMTRGLYDHVDPDTVSLEQGDMNVSVIRTAKGRTIQLQFNVCSPRPYSRDNSVVGTRGAFFGYPDRIALPPNTHRFRPLAWQRARERYGSRQWNDRGVTEFERRFHQGRDALMLHNLIDNLRAGAPMDIDVYESLLWSVLGPVTEASVANGSVMTDIPDFTGGLWKDRKTVTLAKNWLPVTEPVV